MSAPADRWWLATLGRTVVWARLREREAGTAEVFDSDGNTLITYYCPGVRSLLGRAVVG